VKVCRIVKKKIGIISIIKNEFFTRFVIGQTKFGLDESNKISFCNISMKIAYSRHDVFPIYSSCALGEFVGDSLQFLFLLIIKIHFKE